MTPYGAPWHPILVHFPIVLLLVAVLIGLAACWPSLRRLRLLELILVAVGLASAILTRQTGEQSAHIFNSSLDRSLAAQQTLDRHDAFSKGVVITFGLLFLLRLGVAGWQLWQERDKIAAWKNSPRQLAGLVLGKLEIVPRWIMVIYLLGSLVGLGLLFLTGYYGGELVYTYGVGSH